MKGIVSLLDRAAFVRGQHEAVLVQLKGMNESIARMLPRAKGDQNRPPSAAIEILAKRKVTPAAMEIPAPAPKLPVKKKRGREPDAPA